jgi:Glycosyl transferase family 11
VQIIVKQISGLGNQLSQYAAGRYYANRYGAEMEVAVEPPRNAVSHGHARPFLLSNFSIASRCRELSAYDRVILAQGAGLRDVAGVMRRVSRTQVFREAVTDRYRFHADLPIERDYRRIYLVGYWQAYRYAEEVVGALRDELRFREPAQGRNLEALEQIRGAETSVSLHIRRGDYTLAAEGNIALPMSYYYEGIRFFQEMYKAPTFFVFSDDIRFARQNLPSSASLVFVDHNDSYSAHEDLRLMSSCRSHIIANSTFSWWAAWLNSRAEKVVFSPKYWHLKPDSYFPDLLPPDWVLAGRD